MGKTFLDSFRYLDTLGRFAREGVQAVFHNTLAASDCGLLDPDTFAPRPNYWAALLWSRLMGPGVLDAGPSWDGFHIYAHCLQGKPGGVALLAINTSRSEPVMIDIPAEAGRYTLTAEPLDSQEARPNGEVLALGSDDALPALQPARAEPGTLELAPASITFLTFEAARNGNCP